MLLDDLKTEWQAVTRDRVGRRFTEHHERYEQLDAPGWKALRFFAAIFVTGMAVTLPLVSGYALHALPFAALAILLLPGESRTFAALLDRLEAMLRRQPLPKRPRPAPRTTTQLERAELERALHAVAAKEGTRRFVDLPPTAPQPSAAAAPVDSVRAVRPLPVTDLPVAPAQIVPRPRIAGTLKIWSTDEPASDARPKVTIVMFPPRADS